MRAFIVLCAVFGFLFMSEQKADAGGASAVAVSGQPVVAFGGCGVQAFAVPAYGYRQQVFVPQAVVFRQRVAFVPSGGAAAAPSAGGGSSAAASAGGGASAAASLGFGGRFFGRSRATAVTRTGIFGRTVSRSRAVSR
jgi:hypothetical protein